MGPLPISCLKGSAYTMHLSTKKSLETLRGARTARSVQSKCCAVIKQLRGYGAPFGKKLFVL